MFICVFWKNPFYLETEKQNDRWKKSNKFYSNDASNKYILFQEFNVAKEQHAVQPCSSVIIESGKILH